MKKIVLLFLATVVLASCGRDKEANKDEAKKEVAVEKDQYSVVLEAIYEKDDVLKVVYKLDGYWKEDGPIEFKVKGNPLAQKLDIKIPAGVSLQNVKITLSTNKEQKTVKINTLNIVNKGVFCFENGTLYGGYFDANEGLSWDEKAVAFVLTMIKLILQD